MGREKRGDWDERESQCEGQVSLICLLLIIVIIITMSMMIVFQSQFVFHNEWRREREREREIEKQWDNCCYRLQVTIHCVQMFLQFSLLFKDTGLQGQAAENSNPHPVLEFEPKWVTCLTHHSTLPFSLSLSCYSSHRASQVYNKKRSNLHIFSIFQMCSWNDDLLRNTCYNSPLAPLHLDESVKCVSRKPVFHFCCTKNSERERRRRGKEEASSDRQSNCCDGALNAHMISPDAGDCFTCMYEVISRKHFVSVSESLSSFKSWREAAVTQ